MSAFENAVLCRVGLAFALSNPGTLAIGGGVQSRHTGDRSSLLGHHYGTPPFGRNAHHLLIAQAMTSQNLPAASSRAWSLSSLPGPSCPASPPPPRTTGVHQRTSRILCTPMIGSAHQSFLCGPKKSPFIICCSVYAYTRRGLTSHVTLTLL